MIQLDDSYQKEIQRLNQLAEGKPVHLIAALHARGKLWKWLGDSQVIHVTHSNTRHLFN